MSYKSIKIKITGASGYIGTELMSQLKNQGFNVSALKRADLYSHTETLSRFISGTDIVINLAGSPILKRWNTTNKKTIYKSRISTTTNLVNAINLLPANQRPKLFITASAIGIYKSGEKHNETSTNFDTGFVGKVVYDWENASKNLNKNVQRVIFRIGLVLGKKSPTIKKMVPVFKFGLGGAIGKGNQPFPFVHINDVVAAFLWAIKNGRIEGTFNLVAPQSISNKDFTIALAKKLSRPVFFKIPEFILKIIYGEASTLLTESPEVIPVQLLKSGFKFNFPTIKSTINNTLA